MSLRSMLRRLASALVLLSLSLFVGATGCSSGRSPTDGGVENSSPDAGEDTVTTRSLPIAPGDTLRQVLALDDGYGLLFSRPDGNAAETFFYQATDPAFSAVGTPLNVGTWPASIGEPVVATVLTGADVVLSKGAVDTESTPHLLHLTHSASGAQQAGAELALASIPGAVPFGVAPVDGGANLALSWQGTDDAFPSSMVVDLGGVAKVGPLLLQMDRPGDGVSEELSFEDKELVADSGGFSLALLLQHSPLPADAPTYEVRVRAFDGQLAARGDISSYAYSAPNGIQTTRIELSEAQDGSSAVTWSYLTFVTGAMDLSHWIAAPIDDTAMEDSVARGADYAYAHYGDFASELRAGNELYLAYVFDLDPAEPYVNGGAELLLDRVVSGNVQQTKQIIVKDGAYKILHHGAVLSRAVPDHLVIAYFNNADWRVADVALAAP